MKIAIITVNYNGKKDTLEFLESLKKLTIDNGQLKIIVVDNGSSDGSVRVIQTQYPDIDILQNGENKGFAGGYNRGIEYALIWGADYILIINNDTIINDSLVLKKLIGTAKSDPKIGVVSPKIYFAPGFEFHKDRYNASDKGRVIWYAGGHFDWDNVKALHRGLDEVDKGRYTSVENVDFVSGACMLIKRQVVEKIGLFDDDLFAYLEDVDFLKRVKEAGFKIFYNGKTGIYHKVSQTAGIGSPQTDYYHTRNRLILGFRYSAGRTKFALLREALKFLLFGRNAQRKGVFDFLTGQTGGVSVSHPPGVQIQYPLELSITIVSYNTADLTKNLLRSIFDQNCGFDPESMEVIVLDNGSDDNCQQVIENFLPKIKYLQNKENEGFAKGYNKVIKYSQGEYILMLNSDIEALSGSLSAILHSAQQFKGNAVLGGRLYFPDMSDQDSCFHPPTITGAIKEYFFAKKGSYFMYLPKSDELVRVEGMVMACYLMPHHVITKVGLLDEGTFIFFEDIEYASRLKRAGIPLYFVPKAKFIHHHGGATGRLPESEAYQRLQKAAIYYHGKFYYFLLSKILWLGQKFGKVKTPVSHWMAK